MQIPSSLKIGALTYKVILTDDDEELDGATGCISERDLSIWIDKRYPSQIQEIALLHEIIHALNTTIGDSQLGHAFIESFSGQLYQVLKDNNIMTKSIAGSKKTKVSVGKGKGPSAKAKTSARYQLSSKSKGKKVAVKKGK